MPSGARCIRLSYARPRPERQLHNPTLLRQRPPLARLPHEPSLNRQPAPMPEGKTGRLLCLRHQPFDNRRQWTIRFNKVGVRFDRRETVLPCHRAIPVGLKPFGLCADGAGIVQQASADVKRDAFGVNVKAHCSGKPGLPMINRVLHHTGQCQVLCSLYAAVSMLDLLICVAVRGSL